jgi:hypothetical protein
LSWSFINSWQCFADVRLPPLAALTARERAVLALMAEGAAHPITSPARPGGAGYLNSNA